MHDTLFKKKKNPLIIWVAITVVWISQFFLELITTQLRFHMVSPQLVLLIILTMQSYKFDQSLYYYILVWLEISLEISLFIYEIMSLLGD